MTSVLSSARWPPLAVSEPLPLNPIEAVAAGAVVSAGGKTTKGEFVVAPIPISDRAVGSGLGLTAAYTFAKTDADDSSPPPVVGAGGFYTNNGSWGGAVATKLSLEEDRYRLAGAGFVGSINYDLFPAGADREGIAITQEIEFVAGEFLFGLGKRWYAGAVATWAATKVRREDDDDNVEGLPIPRDRLDSTLVGLGVTVERDSRDSMFYPTTGSRLQFVANHNDTGLGGEDHSDLLLPIEPRHGKLRGPMGLGERRARHPWYKKPLDSSDRGSQWLCLGVGAEGFDPPSTGFHQAESDSARFEHGSSLQLVITGQQTQRKSFP